MVAKSVDEYVSHYPENVQEILNRLREMTKRLVPTAKEDIMYAIIGYKLENGRPLIYYGAFARHIGLYATPSGQSAFEKELSVYKQGKGSVQLPLDQPIPYELIERIIVNNAQRFS